MSNIVKISTAVVAALVGFALLFCVDPIDRETLRWRSAIDIPVNVQLRAGWQTPYSLIVPGSVVMDLSSGVFSPGDEIALAKKFEDVSAEYFVTVDNQTEYDFTFYALIAPVGAAIGSDELDLESAYELATNGDPGLLGIINLLGSDGLEVPAGSEGSVTSESTGLGEALADVILYSSPVAWRWLAKISVANYGEVGVTDTLDAKVMDARLRLRISGTSSMDSLFTSF